MKSTGEVMGIGHTYQEALYKAVVAAHLTVPAGGNVLITVSDRDKPETAELAKGFVELGYHLTAPPAPALISKNSASRSRSSRRIHGKRAENCEKYLKSGRVDMLVNIHFIMAARSSRKAMTCAASLSSLRSPASLPSIPRRKFCASWQLLRANRMSKPFRTM